MGKVLIPTTCAEDWRHLLADPEKDPTEIRDLSDDAIHSDVLARWRARLVKRLANRPEGFSKNGKLIPGCRYRALNAGEMNKDTQ